MIRRTKDGEIKTILDKKTQQTSYIVQIVYESERTFCSDILVNYIFILPNILISELKSGEEIRQLDYKTW